MSAATTPSSGFARMSEWSDRRQLDRRRTGLRTPQVAAAVRRLRAE